ncbi:MAG TPA: universal stress protein [Rhizomicrobium sp.]|nr:universal stress protein [Rhizomicrobium sp.]
MTVGKILAPVDGSERDHAVLSIAIRVAKLFDAHVVALFAHSDPIQSIPSVPLTAEAMRAVVDGQMEQQRLARNRARDALRKACGSEDIRIVPAPCRAGAATASLREAVGYPPKTIAAAASLSDFTVLPPCGNAPGTFEIAIDAILVQRRPLLLAPKAVESLQSVFVGWDGSAAAAHALSAAMPFLTQARSVTLVCLDAPGKPDFPTDDVAGYLKAHDIDCSARHLRIIGTARYGMLADYARDNAADLLVAGGFGHSRVRETFLGGVTNELLHEPPLPILLMH